MAWRLWDPKGLIERALEGAEPDVREDVADQIEDLLENPQDPVGVGVHPHRTRPELMIAKFAHGYYLTYKVIDFLPPAGGRDWVQVRAFVCLVSEPPIS